MAKDRESLIALFIDYDNIAIGLRESGNQPFEIRRVLERLLEKGRIIYKRAYADWYLFSDGKHALHEHAIEMIDIPMRRNIGKNSADIRLVVDALDLCYTKEHIDTFVIGSGDSDFTPLVSKLKENEKRVIGFGLAQSTSNLLANNCDEFIFYEDLVALTVDRPPLPVGLSKRQHDAFGLVLDAVAALLRENKDVLWGSLIKDTIRRKRPSFTESQYGYNSFSSLLEDAAKHQLIGLIKDPKSGGTPVVTGFGLANEGGRGSSGSGAQAAPSTSKGPSLVVKQDSSRLPTGQDDDESRGGRGRGSGRNGGRGRRGGGPTRGRRSGSPDRSERKSESKPAPKERAESKPDQADRKAEAAADAVVESTRDKGAQDKPDRQPAPKSPVDDKKQPEAKAEPAAAPKEEKPKPKGQPLRTRTRRRVPVGNPKKTRRDEAKADQAKQEAPQQEAPKQDAPKQDAPKQDEPAVARKQLVAKEPAVKPSEKPAEKPAEPTVEAKPEQKPVAEKPAPKKRTTRKSATGVKAEEKKEAKPRRSAKSKAEKEADAKEAPAEAKDEAKPEKRKPARKTTRKTAASSTSEDKAESKPAAAKKPAAKKTAAKKPAAKKKPAKAAPKTEVPAEEKPKAEPTKAETKPKAEEPAKVDTKPQAEPAKAETKPKAEELAKPDSSPKAAEDKPKPKGQPLNTRNRRRVR